MDGHSLSSGQASNSLSSSCFSSVSNVSRKTPFLIGVAGGTASGKSTVCRKIMEKLGQDTIDKQNQRVVCISQDSFYRELQEQEREEAFKGNYNFDHPDALDNELIQRILMDVLHGKEVQIPIYDFTSMRKTDEFKRVHPADVVLIEGILVFYYPEIRELFHMKLFVDTDPDTRLARRVLRDVQERGRDLEFVLNQYTNFVKPSFEDFCLPTKKYADVIIPRGADNEVAINLIMKHIEQLLEFLTRMNRSASASTASCLESRSSSPFERMYGGISIAIDLIVQTIRDFMSNNERSVVSGRPTTPTTVGLTPPVTVGRPRMFSGSGSFSTMYGSSPPPARPH